MYVYLYVHACNDIPLKLFCMWCGETTHIRVLSAGLSDAREPLPALAVVASYRCWIWIDAPWGPTIIAHCVLQHT